MTTKSWYLLLKKYVNLRLRKRKLRQSVQKNEKPYLHRRFFGCILSPSAPVSSDAEYEWERSMNQRQLQAEYDVLTFTAYFYRKGNGGFRENWA